MFTYSWFEIEPHPDQYAGNCRLLTPSEGLTLFSRLHAQPEFWNYTDSDFYSDQLFNFQWESVKVDRVKYKLDGGKVVFSMPITLTEQVFTNNSDSEQEMSVSVNETVTNSSAFKYSTGFTVTNGMEFSGAQNFVHRLVSGTVC